MNELRSVIIVITCVCLLVASRTVISAAKGVEKTGGYMIGLAPEVSETASSIHESTQPRWYGSNEETVSREPRPLVTPREDNAALPVYAKDNSGYVEELQRTVLLKEKKISILEARIEKLQGEIQEYEHDFFMTETRDVRRYEVKKGDSLWKIAKRADVYNDPYRWITIYNANMDKVRNPNVIYPGQLIEIP